MMKLTKKIGLPVVAAGFFITGTIASAQDQISGREDHPQVSPVLETHFDTNLIIPVVIEGKTYNFLVDTGSSLTVVDKTLASQLTRPLRPDELPRIYNNALSAIPAVSGELKPQHYNLVKPVPFFIGNEEVRDNDVWISTDVASLSQFLGVEISGIIGIETIRKFNWQVDNQKKILTLTQDAPSAREWHYCTGYDDSFGRSPQLWFTFGNDDVAFRVDTGAIQSYAGKEFIEFANKQSKSLVLDKSDSRHVDIAGNYTSSLYILKNLKFNNMPLGEIKLTESANPLYAVGMDFFSRFERYAFIPSKMMFCYDAASIERHGLASQRSISIRYANKHIELFNNEEKNLKNTLLRNGDILLTVNGTAYAAPQIDEVRSLLELSPKGKLTLTILRGTEQHEVRL